ncbi:MAG TPA: GIY-YIG nuclease family protein [Pseudolabrys sp.]|nr:GIY-YIG nuclease family protein [Pseudolabrys sp.]
MLNCADGSYYVGAATGSDLNRRVSEHQSGVRPGYTQSRRPVQLIWSEYFDRVTDAIAMERKLKGWSRAKKRALIVDDWQSISRLSRRRGEQAVFSIRHSEARARSASLEG